MGKDCKELKSYESGKLAILSQHELLRWKKIRKVVNQVKLAILSQSEPLQWEKIGKIANRVKLAILSQSETWPFICMQCNILHNAVTVATLPITIVSMLCPVW